MWEPTPSAELLRVDHLGIQRGNHWVLRGLSFAIAPGEALGVVGASGTGKTTLAWAILGLLPITEGSIQMMGLPWSNLDATQRRSRRSALQAVFQDPQHALPPHRTGWEILEEPLVVHRRGDARQRRETARSMAEQVHFPLKALDQRPHQWSGGLAQRLCLARALILKPRLLVLDEPFSALDPTLGGHLLKQLLEVKAQGTGLLFISHQQPAVHRLCDRQILIESGPSAQA